MFSLCNDYILTYSLLKIKLLKWGPFSKKRLALHQNTLLIRLINKKEVSYFMEENNKYGLATAISMIVGISVGSGIFF